MGQGIRTHIAIAEDMSSIPITHTEKLTTSTHPNSQVGVELMNTYLHREQTSYHPISTDREKGLPIALVGMTESQNIQVACILAF